MNKTEQEGAAYGKGEQMPVPSLSLAPGVLGSVSGWAFGWWPSGEAVGDTLVGPTDHAVAEGNRHADVEGREAVEDVCRCGGPRPSRRYQQQRHAEPPEAEQIPRSQPGPYEEPERDLSSQCESAAGGRDGSGCLRSQG